MLNVSEEVCEDLASDGDPASTEVSQCIGSECSSRDVWDLRVKLGSDCGDTDWSDLIEVRTTEDQ